MEYEGIYRKTGGSSQSKQITQLFERGDYDAFDLSNVEVFNDISSVTSVLKTYFRQLPNPLLTHELHESFVAASGGSSLTRFWYTLDRWARRRCHPAVQEILEGESHVVHCRKLCIG
jgi:hypothetical protein